MEKRFHSLDKMKLLSAFLVITYHAPFPGMFGEYLKAFDRFTVPVFLMISGFFWKPGKTALQAKKFLILILQANLIYLVVNGCISAGQGTLESFLTYAVEPKTIIKILFFNYSPFSRHLWYLGAILYVVLIVSFADKHNLTKWLYITAPILLLLDTAFGKYSLVLFGREFPVFMLRNWIFVGLPNFAIGMWIRKNMDRIRIKQWVLILLAVLFTVTSFFEHDILIHIGKNATRDTLISTIPLSVVMFLLALKYWNNKENVFSLIGKRDSAWIYILHMGVVSSMILLTQWLDIFNIYEYAQPVIVILLTEMLVLCGNRMAKWRKGKKMKDNNRGWVKPNPIIIILLVILIAGSVGLIIYHNAKMKDKENELKVIAEEERKKDLEKEKAEKEAAQETAQRFENDSFYQKLADGFDVHILIVGDEISNGTGVSDVVSKWPFLLSTSLKNEYGVSVSYSNTTAKAGSSYSSYAMVKAMSEEVDYDLVILCNGEYDKEEDFGLYYEAALRAIRNKFKNASIISILESSQKEYTNKIKTIQSLAEHYGVSTADMVAPFAENYDKLVKADQIHPNEEGQEIYNDTIMNVIAENVKENVGKNNEEIEIVNRGVEIFDDFQWYKAGDFIREGNTFILKTYVKGLVLGLDHTALPGLNSCKIQIDGKDFMEYKELFDDKTNWRSIEVIKNQLKGKEILVKNEIRISFDNPDTGNKEADGFKGLIMSGY